MVWARYFYTHYLKGTELGHDMVFKTKQLFSHISNCWPFDFSTLIPPGRQLSQWGGGQEWLWIDTLLEEGPSWASADSLLWIPGEDFTCLELILISGGRKWNHIFFFKDQSSGLCYSLSSFGVYPTDSDGEMEPRLCLSAGPRSDTYKHNDIHHTGHLPQGSLSSSLKGKGWWFYSIIPVMIGTK